MACSLTQGFTPKTCKTPSGTIEFMIAELANVTAINTTNKHQQTSSLLAMHYNMPSVSKILLERRNSLKIFKSPEFL